MRYPSPLLLLTPFILLHPLSTHTTPAPPSILPFPPLPPTTPNRNSTLSPPPSNFLGVSCYSLDPATSTVSLHTCQRLFTRLAAGGDIYAKHHLYNGRRFKAPPSTGGDDDNHCIVGVTSPLRADAARSVEVSYGMLIMWASEVLRKCETGGANVFQGEWRVEVTRDMLRPGGRRRVRAGRPVALGGGVGREK
ncbi:MAG: hypothetical protein Q9184_006980 [Pyrenodesmia sp. 2 TL-2023]